ncbi:hypothetical protein MTO96_012568 [Rhipicephalus appendiculatus]
MSGGGGFKSSPTVFGGLLWCARTTSEGRCLVRSFRAECQQGDACEAVPCSEDQIVAAPAAGHKRLDCELTRVPCWSSGLETLVLRAGDSVHVWDAESGAFQRAAGDVTADASQCAVLDGPTLVLLSPGRLRLELLPQTGSGPVVVTLDEQESVQGILSGTSCQVAISGDPSEPSWILLCVLALKEGAYFVAASGTRTTRLPASLFLGSLYESSSLTACLVTLPSVHGEAPVTPWDQLKTVFRDNVTVACTTSGSMLVIESGCPRYRCQLPSSSITRLQGSFFCGSLDYVLVSFGSGGGAVISQDARGRFQLGDCIEPGPEICCGDLLGLGSEQVVAWEPASSHIRCLQPSRFAVQHEGDEEAAAAGSQASQVLVNLLQHYSGASQAALEKLRRAREQAEALLHENTQPPSATDSNPARNVTLLPVLPMEQQPLEQAEQAVQVPEGIQASGLLGPRLGPSAAPGHQCIIDVHRLPWSKQGRVPPRLALWSLTAAQPSRHYSASTSVTWRLSSLDALTRLYNTLYVCCDGASPLFQANVELLPEGGLCLRAQDEEQLSLFEQWLWQQLPGAKDGMTRACSSTVQTRLATLLRSEVQGVRALLHEPYVEARRSLQSTEWQTDFLAQLVTDVT